MELFFNLIAGVVFFLAGWFVVILALGEQSDDISRLVLLLLAAILFYQSFTDRPNYLLLETNYQTQGNDYYVVAYIADNNSVKSYEYPFNGSGNLLTNCLVKDNDNWACDFYRGEPAITMINGEIPLKHIPAGHKKISYWRYLKLYWFD